MKKLISLLMMILLLLSAALAEVSTPTCTTVTLATGSVQVYDFGENRLHAYVSGDALGDVCYAVESPTGVVLLESTAFTAGNDAWKAYVDTLGKPVAGKLMAYHPTARTRTAPKPLTPRKTPSRTGRRAAPSAR